MYTYVLKDSKLGIYKIGKTKNPHGRFKSLCVRGIITPIALINRDVEKKLHRTYKANRVRHPYFKKNGGTEWFKPGGKFDKFIEKVDTGVSLPYITVHEMVTILREKNVIIIDDLSTKWEVDKNDYSHYMIGREILLMLKFITREGRKLSNKDANNILLIGGKISVSEDLLEVLLSTFKIYIGLSRASGNIKTMADEIKYKSRLRKITLDKKELCTDIFLLLNRVLLK